jgi:hypothetical protein
VQVRAVCPSLPQLLHFWGDRFLDGSDSAIIISNSDSAWRMVSLISTGFGEMRHWGRRCLCYLDRSLLIQFMRH